MSKVTVGFNLGMTSHGKSLADGAVAVMVDGVLKVVVAEERITKVKHAGGFENALTSSLAQCGVTSDLVDQVVVSNCCDHEFSPDLSKIFPNAEIVSCNHHISHALSSHCSSGYDKSLSIVLDGGGNVLSSEANSKWWTNSREQQSYYLINSKEIKLISRDFEAPYEMGFGEVFRAFTKFLGLGSSENAGKLMALAAYGDKRKYSHIKIFSVDDNNFFSSEIKYCESFGPQDADKIVSNFLSSKNVIIPSENKSLTINQFKADIAAWVQSELEKAIFQKVNYLSIKYPELPICISGGVGYNCRANGYLQKKLVGKKIFFSPFAGDLGQCIGNACYGDYIDNKKISKIFIKNTHLGSPSSYTFKDILNRFSCLENFSDYLVFKPKDMPSSIVNLLCEGKVGALHEGRSEVGPRALGNRSIIARGDCCYIRDRINDIKERELFMPLAPVFLEGDLPEFFKISDYSSYSFMTTAIEAKPFENDWFCGFLHKDRSARVQSVSPDSNSFLAEVLKLYSNVSKVPAIINTSFNPKGKPISEDIDDAISYFCKMGLDFLSINGTLVLKLNNAYTPKKVREFELVGEHYYSVSLEHGVSEIERILNKNIVPRNFFVLFDNFCRWFESGKKTTTIRFVEGVDFVSTTHLPLYENKFYSDDVNLTYLMHVHVVRIVIKRFNELAEEDAINDGFSSLFELKSELLSIYGDELREGFVTIYHIRKSSFCT